MTKKNIYDGKPIRRSIELMGGSTALTIRYASDGQFHCCFDADRGRDGRSDVAGAYGTGETIAAAIADFSRSALRRYHSHM